MSTIDKINAELTALQNELSELHHYTLEIATAKDSSVAVIKMSQEFLSSFQKRVMEINIEMANAAKQFEQQCTETSAEFENANKTFKEGINQAKATLSEIGNQLAVAAKNVNDLTIKIESINILGHFDKIHSSLNSFESLVKNSHADLMKLITQSENLNYQRHKKVSNKQSLLIVGVIVNILILSILLMKFGK